MAQPAAAIGVLTVSDRAYQGQYEDRGGPAVVAYIHSHFDAFQLHTEIVPDEQPLIQNAIQRLAAFCCLVITTGGTGPAPRDVTPEATAAVCQKLLPGFGELMRAVSVAKVPTAILSRQNAGICGTSLVVNLPGSPKAIPECLDPVLPAMPHAIRLAGSFQKLTLRPGCTVKHDKCDHCNTAH